MARFVVRSGVVQYGDHWLLRDLQSAILTHRLKGETKTEPSFRSKGRFFYFYHTLN